MTGFFAPYAVLHDPGYSTFTGIGGALSGALLGLFSAWLLRGFGRRLPKLVFVPVGFFFGALWGIGAVLPTAVGPMHDLLEVSLLFGGFAGALQLGWFWLVYGYRRVNLRSTWAVVLLASALGTSLGLVGLRALDLVFH
ncbi:MAG: hypothetical protein JNK82_15240 [Myxococcaceae bacterium]|nr:hypothetical protein [Myxococcaceae bacterium]